MQSDAARQGLGRRVAGKCEKCGLGYNCPFGPDNGGKAAALCKRYINPVFRFEASPPLSLYIHFPWCVRKCPYCDFNSHAVQGDLPETDTMKGSYQMVADDGSHFDAPIEEFVLSTPRVLH